jgi:hypothetical protein
MFGGGVQRSSEDREADQKQSDNARSHANPLNRSLQNLRTTRNDDAPSGKAPSTTIAFYRHSGQQPMPLPAILVAAAAAVPNSATRVAASPINFIFMMFSSHFEAVHSVSRTTLALRVDMKVKRT